MHMHNHLHIYCSQYHKTESLSWRSLANELVYARQNENTVRGSIDIKIVKWQN